MIDPNEIERRLHLLPEHRFVRTGTDVSGCVSRFLQRIGRTHLFLAFALTLPTFPSLATTWAHSEVEDPIAPGKTCQVQKPKSWGSYIYDWPSKYDLVFWPLNDPAALWHCEHSGFTALIGDFEDLSKPEIALIRNYLAKNYDANDDLETRLTLLEDIYRLRHKDAHFRNRLLRVLIQLYLVTGSLETANGYRHEAFEQLKTFLEDDLSVSARLEYLYLAANYARQFGDSPASDRYLAQLEDAINGITDPELSAQIKFLAELAKETRLIEPGGRLVPIRD